MNQIVFLNLKFWILVAFMPILPKNAAILLLQASESLDILDL